MATLDNDDLKAIKNLIDTTIDENATLVKKVDISHLPTKDEFFEKMDEVVGELKKIRDEHPILTNQVSRNTNRIENIESHLNISPTD